MAFFNKKNKEIAEKRVMPNKTVKGFFKSDMDDEITAVLAGDGYIREFKRMADTDSICGAVLLAITKTFQSIEWKTINDDKEILKKSLANVNWYDRMEEILSFLVYGHCVFETTIKEDEDGDFVWDGMYIRPQDTIQKWNHDKKGVIESFEQYGQEGEGVVTISMNKCLHFATMKTRNNPKGKSLFRNAYRDWYYRTNIEKIEAIGIERDLTGMPVLTPSEDDHLIDEKGNFTKLGNWAWQTVQNIKRNAQEGLVLPTGWTFELQGSPGDRQFNMNEVIARYDGKIALSMLSQFLILGVINSSGSFALSKEQSHLFYKAVEGFAEMIAHAVNTQFVGAPALGLLNDIEPPKLIVVGVDKPSISDLASFLGRLLKFNVLTPDDKLEEYLRDEVSLPPRDPSTSRIADVAKANENKDEKEGGKEKEEPTKPTPKKDEEDE